MLPLILILSAFLFSHSEIHCAATDVAELADKMGSLSISHDEEKGQAPQRTSFKCVASFTMEENLNQSLTKLIHYQLHAAPIGAPLKFEFNGLKIVCLPITLKNGCSSEKIMIQINGFRRMVKLAWLQDIGDDCPPCKARLQYGLTHLQIRECSLKILATAWFTGFNNLRFIDVSHNQISYIEPDIFAKLTKLNRCWIFNNDNTLAHSLGRTARDTALFKLTNDQKKSREKFNYSAPGKIALLH